MKLNFPKKDFKDALITTGIFSIILIILYCGILLTPNRFGMYYEWEEDLLDTTIEHWPIFLGAIVAISFLCSLFEIVKKTINKVKK